MDQQIITAIVDAYSRDPTRLMDILIDIQAVKGYIPEYAVETVATLLNTASVDIRQTISFYHFFHTEPRGTYAIYLNDSVVSQMMGRESICRAFEKEAGCKFGTTTPDGLIGLYNTSCIGMNDQEPAAIINGHIFTNLTTFRVREIIADIRGGKKVEDMIVSGYGDGMNNSQYLKSTVINNIRKKGPVIFAPYEAGSAIHNLVAMSPEEVIGIIKASSIRGRGGAGFPTALKWELCRKSQSDIRYIFCNADEGEPGTFKDRVILTQYPHLVIEGMIIAGYAVGAKAGILYVRSEYYYLKNHLEQVLEGMRKEHLLGEHILGKEDFSFDIRIQFGAGAYVCGEESALIESAEGKRGEPRDRPPFPVEVGYLEKPTVVNNVETFCSVVKILIHGGSWYRQFGTKESTGTKVLSVSGDCRYPGIYEIEWGFSVNTILEMVGAQQVQAVQVGGPSGACIGPYEFDRILGFEDLSTGGSIIIFGKQRDLLRDVVLNFTTFFIEESCGSCVPCRVLTKICKQELEKMLDGFGTKRSIDVLVSWAAIMKANRCGLGQTALNPILSTIKNFRHLYEGLIRPESDFALDFDLEKATVESRRASER
ncbi:MAG: NAD(P)H-dependent oxidoreductase subunit E [Chitinivibrionales bacterium]|nr:NAD(P)H-dependent oxidoreductase subunit E [Chitinivibrionales bacterium]